MRIVAVCLIFRQDVKSRLQRIYDDLGLVGKAAKAIELALYLPINIDCKS